MNHKPNKPLLAHVCAPWDRSDWGLKTLLKPKCLLLTLVYSWRYRSYWAPMRMDSWRYRRFLRDMDEVCLRSLKLHGALSARQLAAWLNEQELLRMKPERTGIRRVKPATTRDWFDLAGRRGLVASWINSPRAARLAEPHWRLTEKGEEGVHSKLLRTVERVSRLLPALLASGLLVAILNWLVGHPGAFVWALLALIVVLEIAIVNFFMGRSERRDAPGVAVVAIETSRCAGRPIPTLNG